MLRNVLIAALLAVGLLAMFAEVNGLARLAEAAAGTSASPSPRTFWARASQSHTHDVFLDWDDRRGRRRSLELTPETTARLRGPASRRMMYKTALMASAGDGAASEAALTIRRFALCEPGAVLGELGVDPPSYLRIRRMPRENAPPPRLPELELPCSRS